MTISSALSRSPKCSARYSAWQNEQRRAEYERGDMGKATYERWVRCVTYLEEFMRLTQNVADIPVKDVTKGFVQDFEHFLRMNKKAANNTAVRYLRYLKNVMQYAIANKWATEDPFSASVSNVLSLTGGVDRSRVETYDGFGSEGLSPCRGCA